MDKIIDGVNVSECSYAITPKRQCPNKPMPYAKETSCISCKEHNTKLNFCKNNPDCYFKQLKRLQHYQAEFEHELMNDYTYDGYISPNGFTPIDVIKHIKSELQRLEQENNSLQAQLNNITVQSNNAITALEQENKQLKDEITKLSDPRYQISKVNEGYYNRMNTYKQALQEIRDIVSEPCIVDENCQTCNSGCMQKDILDKINEVIGAE